ARTGQRRDRVLMRFVVGGHERQMSARAVMIDQTVVREPVQPRRELGGRDVARASANEVHPHVLEELVGDAALAALSKQIAIDAALVPGIERVERRGVAGGRRKHEIFVALRGGSGHGPPSMRGGPCGGKTSLCDPPRPRAATAPGGPARSALRRERDWAGAERAAATRPARLGQGGSRKSRNRS